MYKFLLKLTEKTYQFEVDNKDFFYEKINACKNVFALYPFADTNKVNDWTAFGNFKHEVPALRDDVDLSVEEFSIEIIGETNHEVVNTEANEQVEDIKKENKK